MPATGRPPRPEDYLDGLDDADAHALVAAAPAPEPPPYSSLAGIARYAEHLERVREWGPPRTASSRPSSCGTTSNAWRRLGPLDALFDRPRYVWVRRGDVVRQAVSLCVRCRRSRGATTAPTARGWRAPRYSFAALRHLVERLTEQDARWRDLLDSVPVLEISYEQLTADLPNAIRRTLVHISVPLPSEALVPQPAMRRQADELSEAWVAAYARDLEPLTTSR